MSRFITHQKKLVSDAASQNSIKEFLDRFRLLGSKFGVVLAQLPPTLTCNLDKIEFLKNEFSDCEGSFGMKFPLAVEFRHSSWFKPAVFKYMKASNLINVISNAPDAWPRSTVITSDDCYLRYHGSQSLYVTSYSDEEIRDMADFIADKCQDCSRVFCYFNNDHRAAAVANAQTLSSMLEKRAA